MSLDWKPSRGEQRLLWWLKLVMRYPIGGGGVIYSTFVAHDPIGTLVFGAMAASVDIGQLVVMLFRAARAEAQAIDRAIDEDSRRHERD